MTNSKYRLLILIVAIAIGGFFYLGDHLTLSQIQIYQQSWQNDILQSPWKSSGIFFLTYVLVTALSIPGALILTLLGAALFGFWWSLLLVSFASVIGATFAFLISRYFLRDWITKKFGYRLTTIESELAAQGGLYLFSLRLVPIFPFFLINLLFGLTRFSVWRFYWISQVGMLAGTVVYLNIGTQLSQLTQLKGLISPEILIAFTLLGVFPWIAKFGIQRVRRHQLLKKWQKPTQFDYNLIVIGAGAGGLVSSYLAGKSQAKVLLIEREKMGGDCLNTGCVPSKGLLHAAHSHQNHPQESTQFFDVMAGIHKKIKAIEPHDSPERYASFGVECEKGIAEFVTPWAIKVNKRTVTAKKIIIATGGKPRLPKIEGLNAIPYSTSNTLWRLTTQPKQLLILGGGPIGCEMAQAFAQLGTKVTLIQRSAHILPKEDIEAAEILAIHLKKIGVEIRCQCEVMAFSQIENTNIATLKDGERLPFDHVLIAIGREANVEQLNIDAIQLQQNPNGTIKTDPYLRATYPHIYAVGDVTQSHQLTHSAAHQAGYAFFNSLFGLKQRKVNDRVMPRITYTTPELAQVGLTEHQAKEAYPNIEITHYQFDDFDRAIIDEKTEGWIKIMSLRGRLIGVTIIGHNAGEMLAEFTLAMTHGLTLKHILNTVHPYPSYSDANKMAAGKWQSTQIPTRILPWLARFHRWQRGEKNTTSQKDVL